MWNSTLRSTIGMIAGLLVVCAGAIARAEPPGRAFIVDREGANQRVILLCNCDASDMPRNGRASGANFDPDIADTVINGDDDRAQLETIRFAKVSSAKPILLNLMNFDQADTEAATEKVRVFDAAGREILGRRRGTTFTFTDENRESLAAGKFMVYAEGMAFGATAKLQLTVDGDLYDELVLHVAPFILAPDTQTPLKHMVVRISGDDLPVSQDYVSRFVAATESARQRHAAAGQLKVEVVKAQHGDVWIQDELQWGYTQTPRVQLPVAFHPPRHRELKDDIRSLLAPEVGYFCPWPKRSGSMDYGGNIEVTPPVEGYPMGRVYYGGKASEASPDDPYPVVDAYRNSRIPYHSYLAKPIQRFFERQKVDPLDAYALQRPIALTTDWLAVGHVDEYCVFLPANNTRGFVLLWSSPELGIRLLKDLPQATRTSKTYLGKQYQRDYNCPTVESLLNLDWKSDTVGLLDENLLTFNMYVEAKIRHNVDILQKELGLTDDEVLMVPDLFCNDPTADGFWCVKALTPAIVNLSTMDRTCLVPDPFIPVYRDYVKKTLASIGQETIFIDNWHLYHARVGGVHCGSNMLRAGFDQPWWKLKEEGATK